MVSIVVWSIDHSREEARSARDEALSNSLFVRQAVMNNPQVMPFSGLYLHSAELGGLSLVGADFSDAALTGADLSEVDFSGTDLAGATLKDSDLSETTFDGADVSGVDFTGAAIDPGALDRAFYDEGDPPIGLNPEVVESLVSVAADG